MSQRTEIRGILIETLVAAVNQKLRDGIRFEYFGRDTESGSARVIKYDRAGEIGMVAVGTPREMWQYLSGVNEALDTVGR